MHQEVVDFLTSPRVQDVGWTGKSVLEVGAQDVNGRARDYFDGVETWEGVDLVDGPGVDHVGDAVAILEDFITRGITYDRVVTTEVLEHAEEWRAMVHRMIGVLAPGGVLVLTCASPARPPHGAHGDPQPLPGEFYRGVSVGDVTKAVEQAGGQMIWSEDVPIPGDTRIIAGLL